MVTMALLEWPPPWNSIVPKASVGLSWVCLLMDHFSDWMSLRVSLLSFFSFWTTEMLGVSPTCWPIRRPQQHLWHWTRRKLESHTWTNRQNIWNGLQILRKTPFFNSGDHLPVIWTLYLWKHYSIDTLYFFLWSYLIRTLLYFSKIMLRSKYKIEEHFLLSSDDISPSNQFLQGLAYIVSR